VSTLSTLRKNEAFRSLIFTSAVSGNLTIVIIMNGNSEWLRNTSAYYIRANARINSIASNLNKVAADSDAVMSRGSVESDLAVQTKSTSSTP
jgi:hypothetical protein